MGRFFLLAATGFVLMVGIGTVLAIIIYRRRERERIWRLALAGWQNGSRSADVIQK